MVWNPYLGRTPWMAKQNYHPYRVCAGFDVSALHDRDTALKLTRSSSNALLRLCISLSQVGDVELASLICLKGLVRLDH
jgi:hypothetical protein